MSIRHASFALLAALLFAMAPRAAEPPADPAARKQRYVEAVVRGEGFLPWQTAEPTADEIEFRNAVEQRKTEMLATRVPQQRPALYSPEQLDRARRNIQDTDWGRNWFASRKGNADFVSSQSLEWVNDMIPELTPGFGYGFTCPNCVGRLSQEGEGDGLLRWSQSNPNQIQCVRCDQIYPSPAFPETMKIVLPRHGQTFSYYLNDAQRAHPEDISGQLAWKFVGYPRHVSFSGYLRYRKAMFMLGSLEDLAYAWLFTGDERYARRAADILNRLAHCYPRWLYHDAYDITYDCDPLYATWLDGRLPMEFKRAPYARVFEKDTLEKSGTVEGYFCAGRFFPSTDNISVMQYLCVAYDAIADARHADGQPILTDAQKRAIERDLLLEWVIGGEPFVGGRGKFDETNNKAPRIYLAQAAVGRVLGTPELVEVAINGFNHISEKSFGYDGLSHESPAYTAMFLHEMCEIPEVLHGFKWATGPRAQEGPLDLYKSIPRIEQMYRGLFDQLRPSGVFLPLADSEVDSHPGAKLIEIGLIRFPQYFSGLFKALGDGASPGQHSIFNLDPAQLASERPLVLSESYMPVWMVSVMRHGIGRDAATLAFSFSPPGGHRHRDSLSIFYEHNGRPMLSDLGYIGDSPMNAWIQDMFSHNLVIVDDQPQYQPYRGKKKRVTALRLALSTPLLSVTEAASKCYDETSDYRRLVSLLKGPGNQTIALDIFRVTGGTKHEYRLFSEVASSAAGPDGRLTFTSVTLPAEEPIPNYGASVDPDHIDGLKGRRSTSTVPAAWQATWADPQGAFRVTMLEPASEVAAFNSPGQTNRATAGRRLRGISAIRKAPANLSSTFVALHEPINPGGEPPIRSARRLAPPPEAGPNAVALAVSTAWGDYLILNEFERAASINGVTFQGHFGVVHHPLGGDPQLISCGASTFLVGNAGFKEQLACWSGPVIAQTSTSLTLATPLPIDPPPLPDGSLSYVLLNDGTNQTGLPVERINGPTLSIGRFALPASVGEFDYPIPRVSAGSPSK